MLNFSNILGSSPLCCSRFTAVLNQSSFEQLSKNADVNAGNKTFHRGKIKTTVSSPDNNFLLTQNEMSSIPKKTQVLQIELNYPFTTQKKLDKVWLPKTEYVCPAGMPRRRSRELRLTYVNLQTSEAWHRQHYRGEPGKEKKKCKSKQVKQFEYCLTFQRDLLSEHTWKDSHFLLFSHGYERGHGIRLKPSSVDDIVEPCCNPCKLGKREIIQHGGGSREPIVWNSTWLKKNLKKGKWFSFEIAGNSRQPSLG